MLVKTVFLCEVSISGKWFWKFGKTDVATSHLTPEESVTSACLTFNTMNFFTGFKVSEIGSWWRHQAVSYDVGATILNFLKLKIQFPANWGTAQRNCFHYPILVFNATSNSVNNPYQWKSSLLMRKQTKVVIKYRYKDTNSYRRP